MSSHLSPSCVYPSAPPRSRVAPELYQWYLIQVSRVLPACQAAAGRRPFARLFRPPPGSEEATGRGVPGWRRTEGAARGGA